MGALAERIKKSFYQDRDFTLFLIVAVFSGVGGGINNTIFSNFLNDVYHLTADQRGFLEFPREMPGVLIMVVLALFSFMGDTRLGSIGMLLASAGLAGLGLLSPTYGIMIIWMMMFSLGTHLCMPLNPNIGMSLSKPEEYGKRLGLFSAYGLVATLFGYGLVYIGFNFFNLSYKVAFLTAAVMYTLAALMFFTMKKQKVSIQRMKLNFVFRKEYILFYLLSIVNGARKQIFLTFAPWVLITEFGMKPPEFAILGIIVAVLSIVTRTIVGNAIDRKGERFVLSIEAVLLIVICLGYAFAGDIFKSSITVIIIAACYVVDNSMSVVEMARSIYVKKIAVKPEDIVPTLSTGVSLDHIVAMSIPILGGILWNKTGGYKYVFLAAAAIAVINLFLSMRMKKFASSNSH